jgi:serine/threonine-protein kinase
MTPSRSIPAPPPAPQYATMPTPGVVLGGKYRIERVLGSGGISVVAAAYHLQLRRLVAIKYLLAEALEYPDIVERFTREARAAARIRGEHVARVIDVGVFEGGLPYIVLEYLDGVDLEEHLRQTGPLSIARTVRHVLQACEALAEAHAAKIVHRDLKPANLFLAKGPDRRSAIKVLDFGVSKIVDEPMTDQTRMLGTVMYMSPEQLRAASEVDVRTDIWSLGVILYELLAGEPPFNGQTIVSVARQVEQNQPRSLTELRPDVPRALEEVIMKCLRTAPSERHATVLELAVALAPFVQSRDRDSVRTITGVLRGSLPPPGDLNPDSGEFAAFTPPPIPPPPLSSDAPMITPVDTAKVPARRTEGPRGWLGSRVLPLATAAFAAAALSTAITLAPPHGAPVVAARPVPSEITLRVTSRTPDARVRIDDGAPIPLPLEDVVARDEREHTITIEAPGHAPHTTTVRFTDDLHVATSLAPDAPR